MAREAGNNGVRAPILTSSDEEPAFLEVYAHSPLVALQLGSLDNIVEAENVQNQVLWIHALQPRIAEIGKSRGAFLVHPQEQGTRYLFIVNPELSTRAQVSNVLNLAADLRQLMSTVTMPDGTPAVCDVAVHVGHFAGAVVGRSAWSYGLYGPALRVIREMLAGPVAGVIKCTNSFVELADSRSRWQYFGNLVRHELYVFKPTLGNALRALDAAHQQAQQQQARRGMAQRMAAQEWQVTAAAALAAMEAPGGPQQQEDSAAQGASSQGPAPGGVISGAGPQPGPAAAAVGHSSVTLAFHSARLEQEFRAYHSDALRNLDQLMALVSVLVCLLWLSGHVGLAQAVLASMPHCSVPLLLLALAVLAPAAHARWREPLLALYHGLLLPLGCTLWLQVQGAGGAGDVLPSAIGCSFASVLLKLRFPQHVVTSLMRAAIFLSAPLLRQLWPQQQPAGGYSVAAAAVGAAEAAEASAGEVPWPAQPLVLYSVLMAAAVYLVELSMRERFLRGAAKAKVE